MQFQDRTEAGRELATRLRHLGARKPVILGLPRGGVVVAREIAGVLGAPLDVLLVRKIGAPGRPELAIGAVGEGGLLVANPDILRTVRLRREDVERAAHGEHGELDRRAEAYRRGREPLPVAGRTIILVDDGIATGATMKAALHVLRAREAGSIIVAVPVSPAEVIEDLSHLADYTVCPNRRVWMRAVGYWYRDFSEVTDAEVIAVLDEEAERERRAAGHRS